MRQTLGVVIVLATWLASSPGCVAPDGPDEIAPDEKYAVFTSQYMSWQTLRRVSPLPVIDETGSLSVCIQFPAGQESYRPRIEQLFQEAVTDWIDLLNTAPPPNEGDLVFPEWRRASVTLAFTCFGSPLYYISADASNSRAYADVVNRTIVLDSSGFRSDGRLFSLLAHEFGHLMGLADTYTEPAIGLDVYGQPEAMMQYAQGFTEDDRAGVWNLWRYIQYGGAACGPGYRQQAANSWGTYCILSDDDGGGGGGGGGGGSTCTYACADYGVTAGACFRDTSGNFWECDDEGCLNDVYACSDGSTGGDCDLLCSVYGASPGDCFRDSSGGSWECDDEGCLGQVDACAEACDWPCADYGLEPGGCYRDRSGSSWECDPAGCLRYVSACPDAEPTCEHACSELGLTAGQCARDTTGRSWQCGEAGCLEQVSACPSTCDWPCERWSVSPGDCFLDRSGNSWECNDAGCLEHVSACGSSCQWPCSLLRTSPGRCVVDAAGNSWACDAASCLIHVTSCS